MFSVSNIVKALRGEESLLLILPKEVGIELHIANQDLLKFEVKDKQQLLITKVSEE